MSGTAWDRLRAMFRREKRDFDDAIADATARCNETLDRRERELDASAEERLVIEQERAATQDAEYEALRRKIDGSSG